MNERSVVGREFERRIGRLLITATYLAVALLGIGVVLMVVEGISPLDPGPTLDMGSLLASLAALEPAGFLWLGLLVVIATPISRVMAAGVGFARGGDRQMTIVAVGILLVVVVGIVAAVVAEG